MVEFFDDTVSYLKGIRTPFLTKYGASLGVGNVVPLRDFLVQVAQVGLRKSSAMTTLDYVKEGIANFVTEMEIAGIDSKMVDILAVCVFSRREELRKVLTDLVFQSSVDRHLVDYNYNIELCLSSDTMMKVNEPMLVLELFLRGCDGKQLERVIIEMNRVEAKAFVSRLKEVEKEIISNTSTQTA